ncbi:MAG: hypothetical protein LBF28_02295, partial [Rickettsiales bacterium]|nr:hypothetical protein [Rickettsiales bacterium]
MNKKLFDFLRNFSFLIALVCMAGASFAAQAPNPRGSGISAAAATAAAATISRGSASVARKANASVSEERVSRAAARNSATVSRAAATTGIVSSRSAARQAVPSVGRTDARTARATIGPVVSSARAATGGSFARSAKAANAARSAVVQSQVSRAGTSRATAVFDDVTKLGGGYSKCRDSYSTCMDQFCAKANETYRRCFCSSRFTEFRDTEAALDQAKTLLMRFEDNNLNAVDKTAAEVTAMYSATVGELAIKNDVSAAQSTLSEISDLLSGKKKASGNTVTSLSGMSLDFSADLSDIWGGDGGNDIFGNNSGQDY